jgi:hypothetical protein
MALLGRLFLHSQDPKWTWTCLSNGATHCLPLGSVSNEYGTASDQDDAEPIWQRQPFPQEEDCKNCHKDDAELVQRSNAPDISELQSGNSKSKKRLSRHPIGRGTTMSSRDGRFTPWQAAAYPPLPSMPVSDLVCSTGPNACAQVDWAQGQESLRR